MYIVTSWRFYTCVRRLRASPAAATLRSASCALAMDAKKAYKQKARAKLMMKAQVRK